MEVVYQSHPDITIGATTFRNVPTIIQFEDMPLMEVGRFVDAGFTTKFHIFHSDGTDLAVVKGAQIYETAAGKLTKIHLRHEPNLTVCELEGRPLFELRRRGAASLNGWAELYAPEGVLVKTADANISAMLGNTEDDLVINEDFSMGEGICDGAKIGIQYLRDKGIRLGLGSRPLTLKVSGKHGTMLKLVDIQQVDPSSDNIANGALEIRRMTKDV
jgi:hypothetical protein